ncbi:MAG: 4'-phosphopantetheinyl transferase superfamily protein [Mariniphaga sp.]|nr:4'-phosphopantetheinyl transferase superfamily protein [Mariniphaga sp.]
MMAGVEIIKTEIGLMGIKKLIEQHHEPAEDFIFKGNEKEKFRSLKNIQRKKEFLAVRSVLQEMTGEKSEIRYNKEGKPRIAGNSQEISISHSADLAVVLLSRQKAGVDVENVSRNIRNVITRFLSEDEWRMVKNSPDPHLSALICWCAKEAAYKHSGSTGMDFKSQIIIHPFEPVPEGGKFSGEMLHGQKVIAFHFNYLFFENNVIVNCVEKSKNQID